LQSSVPIWQRASVCRPREDVFAFIVQKEKCSYRFA
jgi:hypothetical protein